MNASLDKPAFLSAPNTAMLCGVTRNTVCTWIRQGKLDSYQTVGGKNLIRPDDLICFMESHHMFVPPALREMALADARSQTPGAEPVPDGSEPAVLVVDDLPDARRLAAASLKKLGMPILEAADGYEALHLLMGHPEVALVILDIMMPGQLGSSTLKEIREQNLQMPVIVVTGYAHERASEMLDEVKPDLLLTKPYRPAELLAAAQGLLQDPCPEPAPR